MAVIVSPFLMLFLLICLGGFLNYIGIMESDFTKTLSNLVIRVTFPAMLFTSVYNNITWDILQVGVVFPVVAIIACIVLAITAHFSGKYLQLKGKSHSTYLILCTNGNNIFLPVPIILSLFGPEYLVYAFLFELGAGLFYWTYGVSLFQDKAKFQLGKILNANLVALLLGLIFGLFEVTIPQTIIGGLGIIGDITVGSAMLVIGSLMVSLLQNGFTWRKEIIGVLLHRHLLSPFIAGVLLLMFPFERDIAAILILMLSMPSLASTALVASIFGADEDLATLGVVFTTAISLLLVPLILQLVY